jgi:flagellar biosynthetic protein FliP
MKTGRTIYMAAIAIIFVLFAASVSYAEPVAFPKVNIQWGQAKNPQEVSSVLQTIIMLTVLSLAPAIIVMMTSFTRIVIVLSFLRHALGTQMIPPNQVLISFAMFLTFLTMMPTFEVINREALQPYMEGKKSFTAAMGEAEKPLRKFMIRQTRKKDMELFIYASKIKKPRNIDDIPTLVIIPSFILSELKTSFTMGFTLFITFLVVDLVIASILMSMGMFMLPPMMISLPIKILLFVLVDGWYLVVKSILLSFR